jgi:putative MATE family efflux protein
VEILGERLLQASGRTVYTLFTQGIGAVLNILLDPLFILGSEGLQTVLGIRLPFFFPAFGVAGAAIATVIGQWVGALVGFYFNFRHNPEVQLALRYIKPDRNIIRGILAVGIPSIIMNSIGSVMNFCMNQILQGFHETATGVFGIYYKLQSFFFMPLFGINNATISIVAFNYGARKPERITKTLWGACFAASGFMIAGLLAFQLIPGVLLNFFNPSEEFLRIGIVALRIISIHFPLAAVGIALGASFQALGDGIYATITSLCRQMIALLPAAYLLSLTGEVANVWWSFPIAEVVSLTATLVLFTRIFRKKVKPLYNK